MITEALNQLLEGHSLSMEQAEGMMAQVMAGEATPAQIAGLLIALRVKGETVEEISGCARAMRRAAVKVTPQQANVSWAQCRSQDSHHVLETELVGHNHIGIAFDHHDLASLGDRLPRQIKAVDVVTLGEQPCFS